MRPLGVAAMLLLVTGLAASPAYGAALTIDVEISAHLRSDYRFTYDYVDTSSPDCPQTIKASSHVVTTPIRPMRPSTAKRCIRTRMATA